MTMIQKRLLENEDENILANHSSNLTNVLQYRDLAKKFGPEAFALRATEMKDMIEACRYTTYLEPEVTDASLVKQLHTYFKRLHQFLVNEENTSAREILQNFLKTEQLYDAVPDVMQCIVTNFLLGHNESYVESRNINKIAISRSSR